MNLVECPLCNGFIDIDIDITLKYMDYVLICPKCAKTLEKMKQFEIKNNIKIPERIFTNFLTKLDIVK